MSDANRYLLFLSIAHAQVTYPFIHRKATVQKNIANPLWSIYYIYSRQRSTPGAEAVRLLERPELSVNSPHRDDIPIVEQSDPN